MCSNEIWQTPLTLIKWMQMWNKTNEKKIRIICLKGVKGITFYGVYHIVYLLYGWTCQFVCVDSVVVRPINLFIGKTIHFRPVTAKSFQFPRTRNMSLSTLYHISLSLSFLVAAQFVLSVHIIFISFSFTFFIFCMDSHGTMIDFPFKLSRKQILHQTHTKYC